MSYQAITLEQAIRGFTLGGAHCVGFGWESELGSIEEGKLADFIVLDRHLLEIPVDDIDSTDVLLTVFNGRAVYEKNPGS